jgi:hypothetical protein
MSGRRPLAFGDWGSSKADALPLTRADGDQLGAEGKITLPQYRRSAQVASRLRIASSRLPISPHKPSPSRIADARRGRLNARSCAGCMARSQWPLSS